MADAKHGSGEGKRDADGGGNRARMNIRADLALYVLIGTLFVGIGIGWVIGMTQAASSLEAQLAASRSGPLPPGGAASAGRAPGGSAVSPMLAYDLATRVDSLESLLAAANEHQVPPRVLIDRAISQLSDGQIRAALGPVVQLDPEDLDEIDDLPGYASHLAGLALDGLIEPGPDARAGDLGEVVFATELDRRDPESLAQTTFATDTGRIYAVFDVDGYAGDKVMVKWYRSDGPELLLFRHFRLTPDEPFSWVWRGRANGWEPGHYRVEVFGGDESLDPLATGEFDVR